MKTGVCLHLFYEEIGQAILRRLRTTPADFDLIVTHSRPLSAGTLQLIRSIGHTYKLVEVPNLGRDVYPLLKLLRSGDLDPYDIVCKLHTKRDHDVLGSKWRNACLDALVGIWLSKTVSAMRKSPQLMMAGPDILYLSARDQMYGNAAWLCRIAPDIFQRPLPDDWGFFAGTMFTARTSILHILASMLDVYEFEREPQGIDGRLVHAAERCFGLLPYYAAGNIAVIDPIASAMKVFTAPGEPRVMGRVSIGLAGYRQPSRLRQYLARTNSQADQLAAAR